MRRIESMRIGLAALALSGCAHPERATAVPPAEDAAGLQLREQQRDHHHGGVTRFIATSLDTLGADDGRQRDAIEKVQTNLRTCMAGSRDLERELLSTLADGVAAGAVDTRKVDDLIPELDTAASGAHFCSVAALDQLHAILTPAQRKALVEKVRAQWEAWREVNHDAAPGSTEPGGRLAALGRELSLSPDQVQRISAALVAAHASRPRPFDPAQAEAHLEAFTHAFAQDGFNARAATENANGALATHGSQRMALFFETIAPLLTPDQRATLAQHLRDRAAEDAPAWVAR